MTENYHLLNSTGNYWREWGYNFDAIDFPLKKMCKIKKQSDGYREISLRVLLVKNEFKKYEFLKPEREKVSQFCDK